jgi:hypothetical protein
MKNLKLFLTIILLFCIFSCNKKNEKNENVKKINDNMISNEITADKNNKNSNENTENVNIKSQKNNFDYYIKTVKQMKTNNTLPINFYNCNSISDIVFALLKAAYPNDEIGTTPKWKIEGDLGDGGKMIRVSYKNAIVRIEAYKKGDYINVIPRNITLESNNRKFSLLKFLTYGRNNRNISTNNSQQISSSHLKTSSNENLSKSHSTSYDELDLDDLNNLKYEVMEEGNESAFSRYSKKQLKILRNMIFAEKGFAFEEGGELRKYFENKSWYSPTIRDQSVIQLNDYDKEFVLKLKKYEGID